MNKVDLIQALKDSNNLFKSDAETVINLFYDKMAEALANGDRVEIRGLCSFFVKNTVNIPGETPKPERRLRLRGRSCRFSRWAKS